MAWMDGMAKEIYEARVRAKYRMILEESHIKDVRNRRAYMKNQRQWMK